MTLTQKIAKFKESAKKDRLSFEDEDNVINFLDGNDIYCFHCKEEALNHYIDESADLCVFITGHNGGNSDELINAIHRIEDSLGVTRSTLKKFECGYETVIAMSNKFWENSPIKFDMFCCIYKSLCYMNNNQLKVVNDHKDLKGEYFPNIMKRALKNIKKLRTILKLGQESEGEFLFNFDCHGLISAMEHWEDDFPERAEKLV